MIDMNEDMNGAGIVLNAIAGAAQMKLQTNVIGLLPCAENCVSGNSAKPGDVVYNYPRNKKRISIQINNTDAEGRVILADAISYAHEHYNISKMLTIATLTGAASFALGKERCCAFSNDDDLYNEFYELQIAARARKHARLGPA